MVCTEELLVVEIKSSPRSACGLKQRQPPTSANPTTVRTPERGQHDVIQSSQQPPTARLMDTLGDTHGFLPVHSFLPHVEAQAERSQVACPRNRSSRGLSLVPLDAQPAGKRLSLSTGKDSQRQLTHRQNFIPRESRNLPEGLDSADGSEAQELLFLKCHSRDHPELGIAGPGLKGPGNRAEWPEPSESWNPDRGPHSRTCSHWHEMGRKEHNIPQEGRLEDPQHTHPRGTESHGHQQ
ncbi:uncharacterized protein LOC111560144 [Felis catus]|uniref:uncharacterized protein LOC111560144 n=1 Tax=Felis catus TaxID=9685 RepID=UPI001D19BD32|nr:uncharacterized protein LOC111560144 [Felis catus]